MKAKNPFEPSLYALAERLCTPVYRIKAEMPLEEFIGWLRHLNRQDEPVDLTKMDESQIAKMFGT